MAKPSTKYKITVAGFKSIANETTIELRPLTILAGANSSGKSSIMQPLLLLKQTLEAQYDPGTLLLHGPNVKVTSADQILTKLGSARCKCFSLKFELQSGWMIRVEFIKKPRSGLDIKNITYRLAHAGKEFTLLPTMTHDDILPIIPFKEPPLHRFSEISKVQGMRFNILRERCFLNVDLSDKDRHWFVGGLMSPTTMMQPLTKDLIHVPALRGNPERTYKTTSVGEKFPGTFEDYMASIIHRWQTSKSNKLDMLNHALETLRLTWRIQAKRVDDTQVELRLGRLLHRSKTGNGDLINIADVGFGISQVLPVLTALFVAKPDQIVYLEEPEIHLHPNAQYRLPSILADAAKTGIVTIVETHSSLILRGIQSLVAKGIIPSDLVKLHWFARGPDGTTHIDSADLDADGSFGNWPEDFDDTLLEADKEYLDAVEGRVPL
ncbi:MAG: AAA family ATPase [Syntrophobacteraceae bacterium]